MITYATLFILTALVVYALPTPVEYEEGEEPVWQGIVLITASLVFPMTIPLGFGPNSIWMVSAGYAVLFLLMGHALVRQGIGLGQVAFSAVTYACAAWLLLG